MKKILRSLLYPLREVRDYFFWLSVPDKEFRKNGIFVEENFFDEKLCDSLVEQAKTLISDKSKMVGEILSAQNISKYLRDFSLKLNGNELLDKILSPIWTTESYE